MTVYKREIPNMHKLADYLSYKYNINLVFAYGYQPYMVLHSMFDDNKDILNTICNDLKQYGIDVSTIKQGLIMPTKDCIKLFLVFKMKGEL